MHRSVGRQESFWYFLPDEMGELEFPPEALDYLAFYRQKQPWDKEAGGQLFWEYAADGHKRVALVTGPRPTDRRSRTHYKADHIQEQIEIDRYYEQGKYLLGDWHTHPQAVASPSRTDIEAIREIYTNSRNPGPGFLLVIVGTRPLEKGLSVSWCNESVLTLKRVTAHYSGRPDEAL